MSSDKAILRADERSFRIAQARRRLLLQEIAATLDVPVESIVASARDGAADDPGGRPARKTTGDR